MHRRPKLAVEDYDVDGVRGEAVPNLVQFAAAHERPRIGSWPPLHEGRPDPMARGGQQGRDLGHVRIEGDEEDVQRSGSGSGAIRETVPRPADTYRKGGRRIPKATMADTAPKMNARNEKRVWTSSSASVAGISPKPSAPIPARATAIARPRPRTPRKRNGDAA